jgi:capsular polysaccharide transport system permease protein
LDELIKREGQVTPMRYSGDNIPMAKKSMSSADAASVKTIPVVPRARPTPVDKQGAGDSVLVRLPQFKSSRSWYFNLSFAICVVLPAIISFVYFAFIASNQYVSEFRFSVRSSETAPMNASMSGSFASAMGGGSKALAFLDNFVVIDYVKSRQAVEVLEKEVGLREIFSSPAADFWARLNPSTPMENLVKYWNSMIDASFDITTGIIVISIRAFSPGDAQRIAVALERASEKLINDVNDRARRDSISFADQDVQRAEDRLRLSRRDLQEFRDRERTADPTKNALATITLAEKMREDLAALNTELNSVTRYMSESAPTVGVLKNKIRALKEQLVEVESRTGSGQGGNQDLMAGVLTRYEDLVLERTFAEKFYSSALSTLETAKSNANSQHTYIATFVKPGLAEIALYPRRSLSVLVTLLASLVAWCAGLLVVYSVRDHARH